MSSTTAQAAKNPKSKEKNDLSKPRQTATSQKRQLRSHEKRETTEPARTATTPTQQKKNTTGRELSQQEISVSPFNPGEEDGETTKKLRSICREFNIDTPEDLRRILKKLNAEKDGRETSETRQSNGDTPKGATKEKKEILSKASDRLGKEERRKEIESREIKIQELQGQLIDKDKHLSDIQLKLEKSEKEIKDLKEQKSNSKKEKGVRTDESIKERDNEISVLKQQLEEEKRSKEALEGQMKNQSDNEHAKSELITAETRIKHLESEAQKSKNDIEQGKSELASAQTRIKDLEIEVQKSKKEAEKNLKPDTKKLKEEIDQLKNRLSQLAGSKLTEGNPAIADLSDMNRPINLGEKFSELYDNQWTDAFEVLQDSGKGEKEVIKELVKILEDAYSFCKEQSQEFHENLRKLMQPFGMKPEALPTEVSKQIKDHRKSLSVSMVQNIQERFCNERQITDENKLKTYAKQCAGLCWFMMVQDPPLFMNTTLPKKNKFDSDKFRAYTKTGKQIDFLVWPALYLHAEGPLLSKGVAQGK